VSKRSFATALLLVAAVPVLAASPALAGDPDGPARAGAVSYLSPYHLGGMGIVDAASGGGSGGGDWRRGCWESWASEYNWKVEQNIKAEEDAAAAEEAAEAGAEAPATPVSLPYPEYGTDLLEGAGSAQSSQPPDYCVGTGSVVQAPDFMVDTCPYGTVYAVMQQYEWNPPPLGAAYGLGAFTWSAIIDIPINWPIFDMIDDLLNEALFGHCLDVFVGVEDVAGFVETIPEPVLSVSPRREFGGITGMDTWLWYDFSDQSSYLTEASTSVGVPGVEPLSLTINARAWVDRVMWDLDGDGGWDRELDLPDTWDAPASPGAYRSAGGSESAEGAAATYVYETTGVYPVRLGMVWRGIYTYSGMVNAVYPYDPVTREITVGYPVAEVRSLLENP
jgi:hypothetical protein